MTDTIKLSIPRKAQYYSVARLVVGGLAAGVEASYDALDDLQLAIGSLLDNEHLPVDGDVTLTLDVVDGSLHASLGPFKTDTVDAALAQSAQDGEFGLRRLLDTIVDKFDIQPSGDGECVTLEKKVSHHDG